MEPHWVGRDRKCSSMISISMKMMAIDVYTELIRKHITMHPSRPSNEVCQLKYLNVGLEIKTN